MSNYRYQGAGLGGVGMAGGRGYSGIEVHEVMHPHHFTYVSQCVKYMIFLLNFVFWLFGGLLLGIGVYAFRDKWEDANGSVRLENFYDVFLNISLVMILAGTVIFLVSFSGCVGALRENTFLLKFYSMCLLLFFLLEMAIGESRHRAPDFVLSSTFSTFLSVCANSHRLLRVPAVHEHLSGEAVHAQDHPLVPRRSRPAELH